MFSILDRYIGQYLLIYIGAVLLLIVGIEVIFKLISQMDDLGENQYTFAVALQYVLLSIPRRLYEYFPMAALVGGLLAMAKLASHNELVIMRSAGLSIVNLLMSVFKTGLMLVLFVTFLGEALAPQAEAYGQRLRSVAKYGGETKQTKLGVWLRQGKHFIHVKQVIAQDHLQGVTIYEVDEAFKLAKLMKVEEAKQDEQGWHLKQVEGSRLTPEGTVSFSQEELLMSPWISTDALELLTLKNVNFTTRELWRYIRYLESNFLDAGAYRLAFWNKLMQPLATAVMLFLAIPMVFGPLRSMSVGVKVSAGALLGFGFFILHNTFGPVSLLYHLPPLLGALIPSLLFFLFGLILLKRTA